ncbi:MAG TPA: hypothetical protein VGE76_10240 [Opitutaceae bacterium]
MSHRITLHCRLALLGGLAVTALGAEGIRSPFMPEAAAGSSAVTQNAPLEYRGFMESGEGIQYRLFDPAKKSGFWVQKDVGNGEGVVVKSHDAAKDILTIEHGGRTLTLEVRKGKIVASANPVPMPLPAPGAPPQPSNVSPAVTQAVVVNPTPADEAKRLEAVAAEVARRRALREQASQQPAAPQPAQPPQQVAR